MKNDFRERSRKKLFFFNVLVPCVAPRRKRLIVVMLPRFGCLFLLPSLRLYRIIWVSLINNFEARREEKKLFFPRCCFLLCFARPRSRVKKKRSTPISIAGTANSSIHAMVGIFPLTQIMHSCSNSIRKIPLCLVEKKLRVESMLIFFPPCHCLSSIELGQIFFFARLGGDGTFVPRRQLFLRGRNRSRHREDTKETVEIDVYGRAPLIKRARTAAMKTHVFREIIESII